MGELLKDKVVVVTGSGRGLGKAFAMLMAQEGAKVVVNDLGGGMHGEGASTSPVDETIAQIKELGGVAVANYDSVSTGEGGERIIKTAINNFGKIDVLVNCAGITRDRMIFNMTEEEWDAVIKVHLYGTYYCTRSACVYMRQQRQGRIINVSSWSALGNIGQANYCAAKAGILGFTRAVARDMGRYGVTCNAIMPFAGTRLTLTEEVKAAAEKKKAMGIEDEVVKATEELSKLLPEDNAPLVVFLASDVAKNINGCTFEVKRGLIRLYSDPTPIKSIYKPERWSVAELMDIMPKTLAYELVNPSPPKEE